MAMVMDEQQSFKHYCRICKKGFGCGRALGGHMRAHGIGDDLSHADDDDLVSDWENKLGGNPQSGNKRMYALRTNPNRLKSCRICRNCGKEFLSWKSFLEHGKCSSDDAEELLVSSPESDDEDGAGWKDCCGWSKGKRSRRVVKMGNFNMNCPSSEEEELANWLVMLSAARVDPMVVEPEESCASASKEEERQRNWPFIVPDSSRADLVEKTKSATKGMFECKACKKVFRSHQALGGHRASHKKVKGCFAAKLDHDRDENLIEEDVITHDEFSIPSKSTIMPLNHVDHTTLTIPSKKKSKVHECSICHRIFTSGQALGGHKRCHWVTSNCPDTSVARFHQLQNHSQHLHKKPMLNKSEPLDLNMPAPVDEMGGRQMDTENPLSFQVPMAIYLQQWIGLNSNNNNNNNSSSMGVAHVDDEAESKIKLAKLNELKDMNMGSTSSPWLQVGIGSTASGSGGP